MVCVCMQPSLNEKSARFAEGRTQKKWKGPIESRSSITHPSQHGNTARATRGGADGHSLLASSGMLPPLNISTSTATVPLSVWDSEAQSRNRLFATWSSDSQSSSHSAGSCSPANALPAVRRSSLLSDSSPEGSFCVVGNANQDLVAREHERIQSEQFAEEKLRRKANKPTEMELRVVFSTACAPQNTEKNRYPNILPPEQSRVRLGHYSCSTDYINASFVWGRAPQPACPPFISTQAPLPCAFADFWIMIYEQNSPIIVMLTRLIENTRQKAHLYWPTEENHPVVYGDVVRVTLTEQTKKAHVHVRQLEVEILSSSGEYSQKKQVAHLQYAEWPDFDVPRSTRGIRQLMSAVRRTTDRFIAQGEPVGPVTVHCSAGIGRSGTFIAACLLDKELEHGAKVRELDPFTTMMEMRDQRPGSIQTQPQFEFLFNVLRDREQYWDRVGTLSKTLGSSHSTTEEHDFTTSYDSDSGYQSPPDDIDEHGRELLSRPYPSQSMPGSIPSGRDALRHPLGATDTRSFLNQSSGLDASPDERSMSPFDGDVAAVPFAGSMQFPLFNHGLVPLSQSVQFPVKTDSVRGLAAFTRSVEVKPQPSRLRLSLSLSCGMPRDGPALCLAGRSSPGLADSDDGCLPDNANGCVVVRDGDVFMRDAVSYETLSDEDCVIVG